jgi:hypothetical protein
LQDFNHVGDEGAKAIGAALQQNSSVQWLSLVRDEFCGCFYVLISRFLFHRRA